MKMEQEEKNINHFSLEKKAASPLPKNIITMCYERVNIEAYFLKHTNHALDKLIENIDKLNLLYRKYQDSQKYIELMEDTKENILII